MSLNLLLGLARTFYRRKLNRSTCLDDYWQERRTSEDPEDEELGMDTSDSPLVHQSFEEKVAEDSETTYKYLPFSNNLIQILAQ
ncbi:hypothetical protein CEXT_329541 [Caerostris extrusa]|uniref:Uncharacterized protein n=1 Tax=Caerostris extrusa TaxID=172846 RepID=A0AAV4S589_CAEEX|nr:hypothetical protein CEXT_329541 [Caerostris extrusa]